MRIFGRGTNYNVDSGANSDILSSDLEQKFFRLIWPRIRAEEQNAGKLIADGDSVDLICGTHRKAMSKTIVG